MLMCLVTGDNESSSSCVLMCRHDEVILQEFGPSCFSVLTVWKQKAGLTCLSVFLRRPSGHDPPSHSLSAEDDLSEIPSPLKKPGSGSWLTEAGRPPETSSCRTAGDSSDGDSSDDVSQPEDVNDA